MTQMLNAMKAAGVATPPMNKRIWQWLYDKRGGYTSGELATALKLPPSTVAAVLSEMFTRGMVRSDARTTTKTHQAGRRPKEWFAVGTTFELLPVKPEFKLPTAAQMRRELAAARTVVAEQTGPTPVLVAAPAPAINVEDGMTLSQAHALYQRLHAIFGGGK